MAVRKINFIGDALFSAVHIAAEEVVIRSDSASDTSVPGIFGVATASGVLDQVIGRLGTGKSEWISGTVAAGPLAMDTLLMIDLAAVSVGAVTILSNDGVAAVGDIRIDSLPANNDTVLVGVTGATATYTWKTTITPADGEVLIGSTVAECADNLASAINDASTGTSSPAESTDYQITNENNYVTATVTTSTVNLTDRIKCARQLAWAVSATGSAVTIRQPIGGADGTLLGYFPAGSQYLSTSTGIALDSEDLTTDTLPQNWEGSSSALSINGRCTIDIRNEALTAGAVALKYEVSNDGGTNWEDGQTAITGLTTSPDEQYITPAEHIGLLRLTITSNTSTVAKSVNVKVIH